MKVVDVKVAFVRVLGRFPRQTPLEIDGEILRFAALQLNADAETIHAYARRQQTISEHQQRIGEYLRLRAFDAVAGERMARFLEDEALRLDRMGSLVARARRLGAAPRGGGCPTEGPGPC